MSINKKILLGALLLVTSELLYGQCSAQTGPCNGDDGTFNNVLHIPTLYMSSTIDVTDFWDNRSTRLQGYIFYKLNSSNNRYTCFDFSPEDQGLSAGTHTLAIFYRGGGSTFDYQDYVDDVDNGVLSCNGELDRNDIFRNPSSFTILNDPRIDLFVEGSFVSNNALVQGCRNETIRVEGNSGTGDFNSYEWFYNGSRVSDGTISNPLSRSVDINVTWSGTRTYELRSYGPYGARVEATIRIRSNTVNTNIRATASGINTTANSVTICEGESIDLQSTVALTSYSWSPSSDLSSTTARTVTATPTRTRTYTLVGTDSNGCSETETITVNVQDPDAINANAGNSVGICVPGAGTDSGNIRSGSSPAGGTWMCLDCPSGLTINSNGSYSVSAGVPVGDYTVEYEVVSGRCSDTDTKLIRVVEQPLVSLESSVDVCPDSEYRIEPFVSGGTGLSFLWTPSSGLNDPTRLNPTVNISNADLTYTLRITTSEGCTIDRSIDLIVDNSVTPNAGANLTFCQSDGVVPLTGATPAGGIWSGPGINPASGTFNTGSVATNVANTIVYTVVTANGCEVTDSRTITVLENPILEAGSNINVCTDASGTTDITLGANPAGGRWSCPTCPPGTIIDADNGIVSNNTVSGSYEFIYTLTTSCTAQDSKTVFFNDPPIASTGTDLVICSLGESAQLNVTTGGGSGLSYVWTPAVNLDNPFKRNPVATPTTASETYTVVVTDSRGCSTSDEVTVRVDGSIVVDAGPDIEVCEEDEPVFLANQVSLSGGVFTGPGVTANTFDPSIGPGIYNITYTVSGTLCDGVDNIQVTVKSTPSINAGSDNVLCLNESPINLMLTANPTGGTFFGPGVQVDGTFDPLLVGVGEWEIFYEYSSANGCTGIDSRTIEVTDLPEISAGSNLFVCIDNGLIDLEEEVSPIGGSFFGNGVTNGIFSPSAAGIGQHVISYTITLGNGCTNTDTRVIQVFEEPDVDLGGDFTVCVNEGVVNLNSLPSISGGSWEGAGVSGNIFDPSDLITGEYSLTYTVTDVTNCTASNSVNVTVLRPQAVSVGSDLEICITQDPVALGSSVSPIGGIFNGPGMQGGTFMPELAGVGTHEIIYTIVDGSGCENSATRTIVVTAPPSLEAGPNTVMCISSLPLDLDASASVPGGNWSGNGVSGGFFNPQISGTGTFTVNYEVDFGANCIGTDTRVITVRDDITVEAGADLAFCFDDFPYDLTADVSRMGGTFRGRGVVGSTFDPSIAGTGIHTITYEFEDSFSCSAVDTRTFTVFFPTDVSAGPDISLCSTSQPINLSSSAFPTGGVFTGPGITTNTFDPSIVGVGVFSLTYSFTDINGCTRTDEKEITVGIPEPIDAGPNITACTSSPSIDLDLDVSVTGGIWSGPGISGSFFSPSLVGQGNYILTYTYDNGLGCISTDTRNVNVRDELNVELGDPIELCYTVDLLDLGQIPNIKGGNWSGRGVEENDFFNPIAANPGTHILTYEVENEFGCRASETLEIVVLTPPAVSAGSDLIMCVDDTPRDLSLDFFPSGGSVSGFGIIGEMFHPDLAGPGEHEITYLYTDLNGCVNDDTRIITVNSKPVVEAGSDFDICVNASPVSLSGSVPSSGGVWSGIGVIANVFDPRAAGLGTHSLYYSFTDISGCSNLDSIRVNVLTEPNLIIGDPLELCIDDSPVNLAEAVNIQGGDFDGDGVTGIFFDPQRAGEGNTIISYELRYNGCILREYRNITVNSNTEVNIGEDVVICIDSDPYRLTDDIEVFGGSFSGNGVIDNFFDPVLAGLGSHLITYDYVNAYGCSSSDSRVFTVQEEIEISAGEDLSLCVGVEEFELTGYGNPTGGIYVGPGIIGGNVFSPTEVGVGAYEITYILESDNGCISTDEMFIVVEPSSITEFGTDTIVCITSGPIDLNFNSDLEGGNWSGEGVVNNKFYPSLNGAGVFTPSYNNTNLDCDIAARRQITVVDLPANATSPISRIEGCIGSFVELEATISEEDRNNNVVVQWYREGETEPLQTGEFITHEIIGEERIYYQSVNQFGCESGQSSYITIDLNNPSAEMEASDVTPNFGKPIQFQATRVVNAISFEWDFGDGTFSTERNPYKFYYESDTFSISLKLGSSSGCESTITLEDWIVVGEEVGREDETSNPLSSSEHENKEPVEIENKVLEVYPLPTTGAFSIDLLSDDYRKCETYLVGMDGQIHNRENRTLKEGRNSLDFNYSGKKSGIYFLMIVGTDGVEYRSKILINK